MMTLAMMPMMMTMASPLKQPFKFFLSFPFCLGVKSELKQP